MDTGWVGWRVVAGLVLLGACSPSNETGSSAKREPAAPEEPVVVMPEPPRPPATPIPGMPNTDTGDTQPDVEDPAPAPQEDPPGAGSQTTGRVLPIWVDLSGLHAEVQVDPVALLTSARASRTSVAQDPKIHWLQGAPHRLVGAVALEGGSVFLASINVATGAVEATRLLDGVLLETPIADEHANVFVGLERADGVQVVRLDSQLIPTHEQVTGARPIAVFDSTLVLASGAVLGADDLSPQYIVPAPFAQVFLGPGHVTVLRHVDGGGSEVTVFARDSGARMAEETVPFRSVTAPQHTEQGTLLLVRQAFWRQPEFDFHQYTQTWIHEVGRGGGAHPATLRANAGGWRQLTLFGGGLVATEREDGHNNYNPLQFQLGFSLPEVRAPRHGWRGERGGTRGMLAPE